MNGFVGEFLSLAGMFKANPIYAALGTTGVVLGAWYMLTAVQRVFFGTLHEPHHGSGPHEDVEDMSVREFLSIAPLAVLCLWIGLRPMELIEVIEPDIKAVAKLFDTPVDPETTVATAQPATVFP